MDWYKMAKINNWDELYYELKKFLKREPTEIETYKYVQNRMLVRDFEDRNKIPIEPMVIADKKEEDKIPSGNNRDEKDFEKSQIEKGKKVEMEHTDNPEIAKDITMDHLEEYDDYYIGLEHMEKALKEIEKRKNEDN